VLIYVPIIRSIKLKLKTKTGNDSEYLRQGLWRTHKLMNDGIVYYMNWLILMRQEACGERTKEDIQVELLEKLAEQQRRNGRNGNLEQEDELLPHLRRLYELIVPSSVGKNGQANQLSRTFLSPLVDKESEGLMGTSKSGRKPRWYVMKMKGDPNWQVEQQKNREKRENNPAGIILETLKSFGLIPLFPLFTEMQQDIEWSPRKLIWWGRMAAATQAV